MDPATAEKLLYQSRNPTSARSRPPWRLRRVRDLMAIARGSATAASSDNAASRYAPHRGIQRHSPRYPQRSNEPPASGTAANYTGHFGSTHSPRSPTIGASAANPFRTPAPPPRHRASRDRRDRRRRTTPNRRLRPDNPTTTPTTTSRQANSRSSLPPAASYAASRMGTSVQQGQGRHTTILVHINFIRGAAQHERPNIN